MDIRTKLVITLIAVSLTSMWVLGFFANQTTASLLQDISIRQLDALAESKARDVANVIESWRDRTRLIASRTQLRINLDQYNRHADPALLQPLTRIIRDAQNSTPSVLAIQLGNMHNTPVVSVGTTTPGLSTQVPADGIRYDGLSVLNEQPRVVFTAPLLLDTRVVGYVRVAFAITDLGTVTSDYTGLGNLGETVIAARDDAGQILVLHDLRHPLADPAALAEDTFVAAALQGTDATFSGHDLDYRPAPSWAATRFIDDVDWGLVVKQDRHEELAGVRALRESMIDLALSLSAFAIFFGTLIGVLLARPLRQLASLVDRIRHGETALRAEVSSEDEVGQLADALNEFLDARASPQTQTGGRHNE